MSVPSRSAPPARTEAAVTRDSRTNHPKPRLSCAPFGMDDPALRAPASYRLAALIAPGTAIECLRPP